jgi:hypothetical protein
MIPAPARQSLPDRVPLRVAVAVGLLVLAGAGLRLYQVLGDASQNVDELALTQSIVSFSVPELATGRLAYSQSAPFGFLLAEKAAVAIGGPRDAVLRLIPLIGSVLALALLLFLVRAIAPPPVEVLSVGLFAFSIPLIEYAGQVKPYSTDALWALVMTVWTLWSLRQRPFTAWNACCLGLGGIAAAWSSLPVALILLGLGPGVGLAILRSPTGARRGMLLRVSATFILWAVGGGGAIAHQWAAVSLATRGYLWRYWSASFAPRQGGWVIQLRWLLDHLRSDLVPGAPSGWLSVCVVGLGVLGGFALWRRDAVATLLVIGPVAASIAAAELRIYPLGGRLSLFLLPDLLVLVSAGVWFASSWGRREESNRHGWSAWLASAAVLSLSIAGVAGHPPVYRSEETKPVLRAAAAARQPGDAAYAYYGAGRALRFYGPRLGWPVAAVDVGDCHRADPWRYLEDLDRYRGRRRVWVFISHALPLFDEERILVDHLDRIGQRRQAFVAEPHPRDSGLVAEALLYDLSVSLPNAPPQALPHAARGVKPGSCDGFHDSMIVPRSKTP